MTHLSFLICFWWLICQNAFRSGISERTCIGKRHALITEQYSSWLLWTTSEGCICLKRRFSFLLTEYISCGLWRQMETRWHHVLNGEAAARFLTWEKRMVSKIENRRWALICTASLEILKSNKAGNRNLKQVNVKMLQENSWFLIFSLSL